MAPRPPAVGDGGVLLRAAAGLEQHGARARAGGVSRAAAFHRGVGECRSGRVLGVGVMMVTRKRVVLNAYVYGFWSISSL